MTNEVAPEANDDIYVPTLKDYGFVGGLAKVKKVPIDGAIMIEEWPEIILNWDKLKAFQDDLKREFGKRRAHLEPDSEEKQKRMANTCPLHQKNSGAAR